MSVCETSLSGTAMISVPCARVAGLLQHAVLERRAGLRVDRDELGVQRGFASAVRGTSAASSFGVDAPLPSNSTGRLAVPFAAHVDPDGAERQARQLAARAAAARPAGAVGEGLRAARARRAGRTLAQAELRVDVILEAVDRGRS